MKKIQIKPLLQSIGIVTLIIIFICGLTWLTLAGFIVHIFIAVSIIVILAAISMLYDILKK